MRQFITPLFILLTLFVAGCGEKPAPIATSDWNKTPENPNIVGKISKDDPVLGLWQYSSDVSQTIEFRADGTFSSTSLGDGTWGRIADGRVRWDYTSKAQGKPMKVFKIFNRVNYYPPKDAKSTREGLSFQISDNDSLLFSRNTTSK